MLRMWLNDSIVTLVYRSEDGAPVAFNALALVRVTLNGRPKMSCIWALWPPPNKIGCGMPVLSTAATEAWAEPVFWRWPVQV